jgi:mono/diheme cytochrome c family protein
MLLTKKLGCPSCNVKLRVADSLPAGKMITCPKCGEEFPVPPASEVYRTPEAKARPRKPAPPPDEDEDEDGEAVKRPRPRKRSKKTKKEANNAPLVLGLAIGGGLALVAGVIVAVVLMQKKPEQVAQSAPSRPAAMQPRPEREPGPAEPAPAGGRMAVRFSPPRSEQGEPPPDAAPSPSAQRRVAVPGPSEQTSAGSNADLIAAGQTAFQANRCGRCHGVGGSPGGGRRGPRGPDLARVGAVRSVDWLMEQIRDPQSHKPDTRMPPSPKISETDLRALATYLASLK